MTVKLRIPGSTGTIEVSDEAAESYRSRGFQDLASSEETPEPEAPPEAPAPAPEPDPVPEPDSTPEPAPEPEPEDVPEGTAAEILEWVDGDPDRARQALDRERTYEKPRIGLSGELTDLIEKE